MTNVKDEHKKARFDIANLLGWFECELQKETNTGSPVDALRELIRALALFSGISEKQIKESLEDLIHTNDETKNERTSK
ncbi:MAG: hypothetical protein BWY69_00658 [Planctomycetes bacterium ADurb.Bin401]|nr:MAG: hypothetical protein BWY69_00658 [Planctomycetes bacterium ADurb.Bin401]